MCRPSRSFNFSVRFSVKSNNFPVLPPGNPRKFVRRRKDIRQSAEFGHSVTDCDSKVVYSYTVRGRCIYY